MAQTASALDPAVLDRLQNLELVARTVVEGFIAGGHRSARLGSSVEFAQSREYVLGDELKHVDWKVFARSDQLVVSEFIEETSLACHLLVDASESMAYGSLAWTKFDYARWCAAGLAHLALLQRDTAGLVLFDREFRTKIPPGNGGAQRATIFDTLEKCVPNGPTRIGDVLGWIAPKLKSRGIVCLFSDLFDDPAPILSGLRQLVAGGQEPIVFQVLDPAELDFDFEGYLRLEGLEGAGEQKLDPRSIREAYLEEIGKHNQELATQARRLNIDFVPLVTSTPVDAALSTYLAHRRARARGGRG